MHPDALACRLRLHLILLESGSELIPLQVLVKTYKSYRDKIAHVSLECKLTLDEEEDLLNTHALDPFMQDYIRVLKDVLKGKITEGELNLDADPATHCGHLVESFYRTSVTSDFRSFYGNYRCEFFFVDWVDTCVRYSRPTEKTLKNSKSFMHFLGNKVFEDTPYGTPSNTSFVA